jgi:hypothetical protein
LPNRWGLTPKLSRAVSFRLERSVNRHFRPLLDRINLSVSLPIGFVAQVPHPQ